MGEGHTLKEERWDGLQAVISRVLHGPALQSTKWAVIKVGKRGRNKKKEVEKKRIKE